MFIKLRLIGEQEDRVFRNVIIEREISRYEFLDLVESITCIPISLQILRWNGEKLPDSLQPCLNMKDFDQVDVKHAYLDHWRNYLIMIEGFRNTKDYRSKKKKAIEAFEKAKHLEKAKFFYAYTSFELEWLNIRKEYSEIVYNDLNDNDFFFLDDEDD